MLSTENLHTVYGSSPERCLILYPDAPRYTIAYANQHYLRAINKNSADVIGRGLFEAFPEQDTDFNKATDIAFSLKQVLELHTLHKSPLFRYDLKNTATNSFEPRFWICETYPLINDLGEIEYIVRMPIDVTHFISEDDNYVGKSELQKTQSSIFQNHPDAVFTLDMKGNFLSVNKNLIQISACAEADLLKMSFRPFIDPADVELVNSHFEKAKTGEVLNFNARAINAHGAHLVLNITHLPIIINSEVVGVYVVAKDVTAVKKAESQLEAYNHRITNILESITDAFVTLDRDFTVTYWNKEAENILSKSREDAIGKNLWHLYPDAVQQKFYIEYNRALKENISLQFQEYLEVMNCWLEVNVYPSEEGLSVFFKDVTKRIEIEKQLKMAKAQYQNLFDLSPLPNWVFDMATLAILDVNNAAIQHYGYSREEFMNLTLRDIRPEEEVGALMEILERDIFPTQYSSELYPSSHFCLHKKKSGEIINVEVKGSTISFQGRSARLCLILDVTERLKAAHELSVSEQRFKALVQEGSDLIHIIDEYGILKYVSPNTERVLDDVFQVGEEAFKYIDPVDKARFLNAISTLSKGECSKLPAFRYLDRKDEVHWLESTITNLMEDPAVKGFVANTRIVTEQINSALKIKESVEQYEIVSEATNDAIYEWNFAHNYLNWNKGFQVLFGHDRCDKDLDRWFNNLHPEDKDAVIAHLNATMQSNEAKFTLEYRFKCADGQFKHVLDRGYLIYDDAGKPMRIIGAMQDVTDRINYIQRLEEKNEKLIEISWMQSHVVRAPLAQILGLSELLACDERDKEKMQLLKRLRGSANELDQVIKSIIQKAEGL
jgi:PAS domain S-box-containing protein